jgi:hypothetical protein
MRILVHTVVPVMACVLAGCNTPPSITVQVLSNGKLMTYVPAGTIVNWVDENNNPVTVSFPFTNPCKTKTGPSATCVVDSGQAIYQCTNGVCEDPGLGVKPTTVDDSRSAGPPLTKAVKGTAQLYEVFCDANGVATADGPKVHYNDLVSWVADSSDGYTLSNFNPANACNPTTITKGVSCAVGVNMNVDATYQVEYKACTGHTTGTGKLHIVVP